MKSTKLRTVLILSAILLFGTITTFAMTIRSPYDAYQLTWPEIGNLPHEEAIVLFADQDGQLLKQARITQHQKGGIYYVPWELLIDPLMPKNTAAIYLVHNHPSGNPTLSRPDIELGSFWTYEALQKGIQFDLLAITANNGFTSLVETGQLISKEELTQSNSGYLSYVVRPSIKILGSGFAKIFADSAK